MRWKIEMEGRCVKDELDSKPFSIQWAYKTMSNFTNN